MRLRTAHVEREGVPVRGRRGQLLHMLWRRRLVEKQPLRRDTQMQLALLAAYGAGRTEALQDLDADRSDLEAWANRLEELEANLEERGAQLDKIEMLAHDALSALSATMVDKRR